MTERGGVYSSLLFSCAGIPTVILDIGLLGSGHMPIAGPYCLCGAVLSQGCYAAFMGPSRVGFGPEWLCGSICSGAAVGLRVGVRRFSATAIWGSAALAVVILLASVRDRWLVGDTINSCTRPLACGKLRKWVPRIRLGAE